MKFVVALLLFLRVMVCGSGAISITDLSVTTIPGTMEQFIEKRLPTEKYSRRDLTINGAGHYYINGVFRYDSSAIKRPYLFVSPSTFPFVVYLNEKELFRWGEEPYSTMANCRAEAIPLTSAIEKKNSLVIQFYSDGHATKFPSFWIDSYKNVSKAASKQTFFFLSGVQVFTFVAFFIFLFFLGQAAANRFQDRYIIYFALMALFIGCTYINFTFSGPFNNELLLFKTSRIAVYLLTFFLFLFITDFLKILTLWWPRLTLVGVIIPFIFITVIATSKFEVAQQFKYFLNYIAAPVMIILFLLQAYVIIIKNKRDIIALFIGYTVVLFAVIHDTQYLQIQDNPYFWALPYGYSFLLICTIISISLRQFQGIQNKRVEEV